MDLQLIIKWFTLIGSTLGVVAFLQNISKEIAHTNKEKWKKVTEVITLTEVSDLQYQITIKRIKINLLNKFWDLYYIIRKNDQDIIGFKSIFRSKIQKKLHQQNMLLDELNKFIQVPFWDIKDIKDETGIIESFYTFDNQVFFESKNTSLTSSDIEKASDAYVAHLNLAEEIANKMEKNFNEIQILANKEAYELILPWKWFAK